MTRAGWWWALLLLMTTACADGSGAAAGEPLSFVFIIVDDLGWIDTGVYGSTFYETPSIDRLAESGARFTQFYTASPVCSPTRASIMTGRHPARVGITNWIGGEQAGMLIQADYLRALPLEEVTMGEAFREAGYATGYIGKWHMGAESFLPEAQGFDWTVAVNHAGQPASYFHPYRSEEASVWDVPDLEDGPEGEYLTDRLTDEALGFLESNQDRPFFLVLSHYSVHTPLQSKPELTARYETKAEGLPEPLGAAFEDEGAWATTKLRQDHAAYAGMIQSTDESVGRILDRLDRLGLSERTAVVFVSDNGGLSTLLRGRTSMPTSNVPLRAGKGWLYEGGVRAPLIVRWPGVAGGGRVIDLPTTTMDLFPTFLDMAALPTRPADHVDGVSLAGLLGGGDEPRDRPLFWHFPHYHGSGNRPSSSVRSGAYKLVEWLEDGRVELFDLDTDPGETRDLASERPDRVAELRELLVAWRGEVGARMPAPNPEWEGAR
jgi:arylsulfatase A-like enzyme